MQKVLQINYNYFYKFLHQDPLDIDINIPEHYLPHSLFTLRVYLTVSD